MAVLVRISDRSDAGPLPIPRRRTIGAQDVSCCGAKYAAKYAEWLAQATVHLPFTPRMLPSRAIFRQVRQIVTFYF